MEKTYNGRRVLEVTETDPNQLALPGIPEAEAPKAPGPKTVVPVGYKTAYRAKAQAMGRLSKASKRSNSDWLAQELEAECIRENGAFDLDRFLAIFAANGGGDALARWPNRNNGWEGRLRMSGAIVLRGIVGKTGVFRTPESEVRLAEVDDALARAFLAKHDGRNGN
jgi:hypothetical protein